MKKHKLLAVIVFLGTCLSLLAADNPFVEQSVKPENTTNAATGNKDVKLDKQFPVTGTIEANTRLRLRSWPWGVVLGLFEPGKTMQVTGVSGEFYQVVIDGQKGYMHKNYISIPGAPASGVEPYYPGDTRSGGSMTIAEGTSSSNTSGKTAGTTATNGSSTTPSAAEGALAGYKGGKLSPAEFGRLFGPVARENMKKTGVPASVTLAQAALETGWGGSSIGDAKNLFGIKGTGPAGTARVSTQEFENGRMVTIQDNFRKYNSWQESFEDHGKLLQNSRYGYALQYKNNPDRYAQEIHKAGYATDPDYASKLISIMKSNNFYQYDV